MNNYIREIREKQNISRKVLSEISNVPYRTIQDWECGNRVPRDVYQLYKVAKALNVNIEDLINFKEQE